MGQTVFIEYHTLTAIRSINWSKIIGHVEPIDKTSIVSISNPYTLPLNDGSVYNTFFIEVVNKENDDVDKTFMLLDKSGMPKVPKEYLRFAKEKTYKVMKEDDDHILFHSTDVDASFFVDKIYETGELKKIIKYH